MIDSIALDHPTIRIDQNREGKPTSAGVIGHLLGALADDNQDLSPERMIPWEMVLQLFQLRSAARSPGAANEHHDGCPPAEDIREPNFLAVASPQRKWRRRVTNGEACSFLRHLSSFVTATPCVNAHLVDHHTALLAQTRPFF